MKLRKNMGRCSALFLVFSMILSVTALAAGSRASDRFRKYSASLSAQSDGSLSIWFSVTANNIMDVIGASNIVIQRYNGFSWVPECILTVEDAPEIQTSNALQHTAEVFYEPVYSGIEYRAVVTMYAEDKFGSSTATAISNTV